ncbi:hypothetical protein EDB81DRAFT_951380, partial [Dactylonectria macrodidyma]
MSDEKPVTKSSRRYSQRRYHTRQNSGPYGYHGGSRRRSGVFARPENEIPRPPTPTVEESVPVTDVPQQQEKLVSNLFRSLVKFWTMILNQKPWPLRLAPGGVVSSSLPSPPADEKTAPSLSDNEENNYNETTVPEDNLTSPGDDPKSENSDQQGRATTSLDDQGRNGNDLVLARLVLHEELSRLRLWKVAFTDEDVDLLSKTQHEIVQSTLKCLVNISNALIAECVDVPKNDQKTASRTALDKEEDVLVELVKKVEALIKLVSYEDDVMTEGDYSETRGSDTTAGGQTFLKKIAENIDRLNRLSHSLCLVLDDFR